MSIIMKKVIKLLLLCCVLFIALLSCSKQSNEEGNYLENQFSTAIPISDVNKSLQVVVSQKEKSFQSGSKIDLIIYNRSPNYLYFHNTSHITLMGSLDDRQWIQVKNAISYENDMFLSPSGVVLLDTQYTVVRPILEQTDTTNSPILLRIVVIAEIMEGETHTGQKVAAYVDVGLKP